MLITRVAESQPWYSGVSYYWVSFQNTETYFSFFFCIWQEMRRKIRMSCPPLLSPTNSWGPRSTTPGLCPGAWLINVSCLHFVTSDTGDILLRLRENANFALTVALFIKCIRIKALMGKTKITTGKLLPQSALCTWNVRNAYQTLKFLYQNTDKECKQTSEFWALKKSCSSNQLH